MKKKTKSKEVSCKTSICNSSCSGCAGFGYTMGFLGAAVYYTANATGFWMGVLGFLKAIVWPAFLVFELMKYIGM